jgi:hypothetical protein
LWHRGPLEQVRQLRESGVHRPCRVLGPGISLPRCCRRHRRGSLQGRLSRWMSGSDDPVALHHASSRVRPYPALHLLQRTIVCPSNRVATRLHGARAACWAVSRDSVGGARRVSCSSRWWHGSILLDTDYGSIVYRIPQRSLTLDMQQSSPPRPGAPLRLIA